MIVPCETLFSEAKSSSLVSLFVVSEAVVAREWVVLLFFDVFERLVSFWLECSCGSVMSCSIAYVFELRPVTERSAVLRHGIFTAMRRIEGTQEQTISEQTSAADQMKASASSSLVYC